LTRGGRAVQVRAELHVEEVRQRPELLDADPEQRTDRAAGAVGSDEEA
jgi:hypothetical protein